MKLGDRKQVTVYMSCPPASFAYTLLPTAARTQGVQQAASCAGNAGVAAGHKCGATPGSCCCPRSERKHLIVPTLAQLKKKKASCPLVLGVLSESASGKIGEEELFAELYGLFIGASPTLGVCTTPDGQPRLISAFLPKTCFQHVQRIASMGDWPMLARWKFVDDFVLAISGMHAQGLAHCNLKPDSVLAQIFPCT